MQPDAPHDSPHGDPGNGGHPSPAYRAAARLSNAAIAALVAERDVLDTRCVSLEAANRELARQVRHLRAELDTAAVFARGEEVGDV